MLLWLETRIRSLDERGNEEMGEVTISIFHPSIHPSVNYLQNFHCFPDILSFIYLPICQIAFEYLLVTGTPTVKTMKILLCLCRVLILMEQAHN